MTRTYPLAEELRALIQGVPHLTANLANASALLWDSLPDLNWVGFYLFEKDRLVLGPFQGKPACIEILPGRGVCGTAFSAGETRLVPDVHSFPGHIACDAASNSEIVIPLRIRVLDLDSPSFSRFSEEDRLLLEACARVLEEELAPLF